VMSHHVLLVPSIVQRHPHRPTRRRPDLDIFRWMMASPDHTD
jgi:hypothetical protein